MNYPIQPNDDGRAPGEPGRSENGSGPAEPPIGGAGGGIVQPRPASTVVVVRDGSTGPEVLLLLRPRSGFAAGSWVFPGGVVDESDYRLSPLISEAAGELADRMDLRDPMEAAGYLVAGVRETWEETGLLIAAGGAAPADSEPLRREVVEGRRAFGDALERLGVALRASSIVYIARWITPEGQPRRYDTRFFLAAATPDAAVTLHGEELLDAIWVRPELALERWEAKSLQMMTPTAHTVRRIAGFGSADEMLHALASAAVPSYLPRIRQRPEGATLEVEELGPA